jgi:hypothetical protein
MARNLIMSCKWVNLAFLTGRSTVIYMSQKINPSPSPSFFCCLFWGINFICGTQIYIHNEHPDYLNNIYKLTQKDYLNISKIAMFSYIKAYI